jgi:myosin heavy subunit
VVAEKPTIIEELTRKVAAADAAKEAECASLAQLLQVANAELQRQGAERQATSDSTVASGSSEELERLRKQVEDLTKANESLQAAPSPVVANVSDEEMERLRKQVEELSQANESLKAASSAPADIVRSLRQQVEDLSKANESLQAASSAPADIVRSLRQQVEDLTKESIQASAALRQTEVAASSGSDRAELGVLAKELRKEVEDLRRFKEEAESSKALSPEAASSQLAAGSSWPPAAASLISEIHSVCRQAMSALAEDASLVDALDLSQVEADPAAALRRVSEVCTSIEASAKRSSEERRRLAGKLSDAEAAASAVSQSAASASASPALVPQPAPAQAAPAGEGPPQTPEAQAAASAAVVRREAAQALREVRLNAERHLAWITKRMKISQQEDPSRRKTVC